MVMGYIDSGEMRSGECLLLTNFASDGNDEGSRPKEPYDLHILE